MRKKAKKVKKTWSYQRRAGKNTSQKYNPSTWKDYELKWKTLRAKVEPVFNLLLVLWSIAVALLVYLAMAIALVWCAV